MAHLVDTRVAGHVVLGTTPQDGRERMSMSFSVMDFTDLEGYAGSVASQKATADKKKASAKRLLRSNSPTPILSGSASYSAGLWEHGEKDRVKNGIKPLEKLSSVSENSNEHSAGALVDPNIWFEEGVKTFHLAAGGAQYSLCVDKNGWLEHLYFGPYLGPGHDLTYLSESDPALTFEPAPPGAQYSTRELLRLVCDQKLDAHQLWSMSATMKGEKGHDWQMTRVENLTWRLRHYWSAAHGKRKSKKAVIDKIVNGNAVAEAVESGSEGEEEPPMGRVDSTLDLDDAEEVLKILDKALLPFGETKQDVKMGNAGDAVGGRQGEKSTKLLEISELGTGDYRLPSLEVCFQKDGSRLCPLVYRQHRIVRGIVPSSSGCPVLGMRTSLGQCAQTLVVEMVDPYTELKVELLYTVFPGFPAVSRRMMVHNSCSVGWGKVDVLKAMSGTFDFLTDDWHLVSLHGGWASERQITTRKLQEGTLQLGSRRGVSSHQTNPFCVLSAGPPAEDHGRCYGISLLYSGNWIMEVEQSETGCVRATAGINDAHFTWSLEPGEVFETPECLLVYSGDGMGALTTAFQKIIDQHLIAERWRNHICPVLINTWEAMYFDVYHDKVLQLAKPAKDIGVEMLVLDDGWFELRDTDQSSLGDWTADKRKLPRGLAGLADDLNKMGLKFGVWVEPEMVSTNSNLYRKHPEWVLYHPKRMRSEGRNQLVLDLTRKQVQDYIIESIGDVLRNANVEYVKWDMNRALTDAYSADLPIDRQGEVYHRYVLGLYRVFHTLTEQFPHVLFESCSSGGGRFDAALLAWCPQCWCSDNTDALCRVTMQMGTSLWAPCRSMGAHVTSCPNHQTHRSVLMKTRFIVALWGTFGLEMDLVHLKSEELDELKTLIDLRNRLAPLTLFGDFYRLPAFGYPYASAQSSAGFGEGQADSATYAWMFVSPDCSWALVSAVVLHQDRVGRFPSRLKMRGLVAEDVYHIEEHVPTEKEQGIFNGIYEPGGPQRKHKRRLVLAGSVLMNLGVPVHFSFSGDSILLELRKVAGKKL
mmetsp:Transcript_42907/g.100732  ORF Transcript_42907/g.100732 Transcript_42907/m.100732 type:complete len:1037 (+) Transcript_42907:180-3290(+)|eukprot:CAMPEP_0178435940 /NCGR_PEP_ID=MMETSP0689_2-20121128/34185_1 /TAXON_ID=160604 /ORGANISM="Amphidinium massartii, Strain CS-259" /LENGTH=1036 /DNA_ID=CAMNT_0020058025 /DNA_START=85 /DNA_END=3195 /DNA_ORIENTATION=-